MCPFLAEGAGSAGSVTVCGAGLTGSGKVSGAGAALTGLTGLVVGFAVGFFSAGLAFVDLSTAGLGAFTGVGSAAFTTGSVAVAAGLA